MLIRHRSIPGALGAVLILAVCAAVAGSTAASAATATWNQLSPVVSPTPRAAQMMAYDAATGTVVMFGGYEVSTASVVYLNDTWTFDGTTWTQATGKAAPPPRAAGAMAYDPIMKQVVLFGGYNGSTYLGDTWTWDGSRSRWTREKPRRSPSPRTLPMPFQDPLTGQACMFGGFNGQFYDLRSWRWTGRTWEPVQTTTQPYARSAGIIANDRKRNTVVVFGGLGDVNPNNTWLFDGTNWALESPTVQPPLRYYSGAAYDPGLEQVVIFGGGPGPYGDTWAWTGTDWAELFPTSSPSARESHSLVFDEALGHAILFGGEDSQTQYNDTWEFEGTP